MTGRPPVPNELRVVLAAASTAEPPSTTDVLAAVTTGLHALGTTDVPLTPPPAAASSSPSPLTSRA